MKKCIIIILIFAIVSFSITGVLIYLKNNNVEGLENIMPFNKESGEENSTNDEKTIDLYGTFDENDIEIERLEKKYDGVEDIIEIPQIKGLKNKEVEDKVNKDIEKRIDEKVKNDKENISYEFNLDDIYRGFSNVISFEYSGIYFNYELVSGERLKFEDLFTKNTDFKNIIRRVFYRTMSRITKNLGDTTEEIYFDKEKNMWIEKEYEYDDNGNKSYKFEEYIPGINEYDIDKEINKFINNGKQEFYFTPSRLYIKNESNFIEFIDIADEVVIYDKYLTEESIYEKDNIGNKNFWTCAEVSFKNFYREYGFAEDNLFYDINVRQVSDLDNKELKKIMGNKLAEETIELAKNRINEYKKTAKENPDKLYLLEICPNLDYDKENPYIVKITTVETTAFVDISYKKEVTEKIIECYRYYNLNFYGYNAITFGIFDVESGFPSDGYISKYIKDKSARKEIFDEKEYDIRNLEQ